MHLEPVQPALVGEEQKVRMGRGDSEVTNKVLASRFHAPGTLTSAALRSVETLVVRLMPELVDLYRHFGRHIHEWTRGEVERSPTVASTKQAFVDATTALERALRSAARSDGIELDHDPALMPYVWSTLFGIADHHGTNMPGTLGYRRDALTRYAARALARGLTRQAKEEAG